MDFEVSSVNVGSMAKALAASGRAAEVFALLSPETRAAWERPHDQRWHPGKVAIEGWSAIVKVGGPSWLEELNYRVTRDSFGPIVGPLVKIGLALSGSSPATIFSRLGDVTSVALRGVQFQWTAGVPTGGTEVLRYPVDMPPDVVEFGWRGILRVGSELTGKVIRVDRFEALTPRSFRLTVSW